ncbi:unnamed protein product [Clonostachys rosea]|uniref:Isochorismatase-like domain-containing protein n=1 Tax=Bionectria ochroleuca TaxID=29856 RepID=A0ABY6UMZ1_BIOOC|nr:unnamed protein product [Clonostachys rosea]
MKPATVTKTALLLIDIQEAFRHPTFWGTSRSTPSFESNVAKLLQAVRKYNAAHQQQPIAIFHVHHHSEGLSSPLNPLNQLPGTSIYGASPQSCAMPVEGEPVITKHVNSALIGTGLEAQLRSFGAQQLIVSGLTTDHCVSTTVRMMANLKILAEPHDDNGIILLRDATATWARGEFDPETVHAVSLASLNEEFASVYETSDVIKAVIETL